MYTSTLIAIQYANMAGTYLPTYLHTDVLFYQAECNIYTHTNSCVHSVRISQALSKLNSLPRYTGGLFIANVVFIHGIAFSATV
jgi:hypothetical protein